MKIMFLGLNELGDICLAKLLENGFKVVKVVAPNQAQRTTGMKSLCAEHGLDYVVFSDMANLRQMVESADPDLLVIASFNRIIPKEIFDRPRLGTINVHPSQLPKLRGPYPINWAIINDEPEIGATVHYLAEKADQGDILAQEVVPITDEDNFLTVRRKAHELGARLLVDVAGRLEQAGTRIPGQKQDESLATAAPKRVPEDGRIDWSKNARETFNLVRGLTAPYHAFAYDDRGEKIEFTDSYVKPQAAGTVLAEIDGYYVIAAGDGVVMLKSDKKLKAGERLI